MTNTMIAINAIKGIIIYFFKKAFQNHASRSTSVPFVGSTSLDRRYFDLSNLIPTCLFNVVILAPIFLFSRRCLGIAP
jgi:hypothetical protein